MTHFDFTVPAELFPSRGRGIGRKIVTYKKFETAADAIRYAIEELEPALLTGAVLEVDEERFDGAAIRDLYARPDFPLRRRDLSSGDKL
jgi:hypothetical protein